VLEVLDVLDATATAERAHHNTTPEPSLRCSSEPCYPILEGAARSEINNGWDMVASPNRRPMS
jgi:hypothetical protein